MSSFSCQITDPLMSELATYIYGRCLNHGERKLDVVGFTRALVLFAAIVYPDAESRSSWSLFVANNLVILDKPSVNAGHWMSGKCSLPRGSCPDCISESPNAGDISFCIDRDGFDIEVYEEKRDQSSLMTRIYDEATDPSRIRHLLESSEARSEAVVSPIKASPFERVISPRGDKRDRWAPLLVQQAEDFEILLRQRFPDFETAFRFFDFVTLNHSGKIPLLKFVEGCDRLRFHGDIKALFFFLDSNNDGLLELSDLRSWREHRSRAVAIAQRERRKATIYFMLREKFKLAN